MKELEEKFAHLIEGKQAGATPTTYIISKDKLLNFVKLLKDEGFDFLDCITAVDLQGTEDYKDAIAVVYNLSSTSSGEKVGIKVLLSRDDPRISSIASIFPAAEWHEREEYDLVGVIFEGHPDLKRIMLPPDWDGHPLRKDYKPPDFWHGMDNRYFGTGENPQRYKKEKKD